MKEILLLKLNVRAYYVMENREVKAVDNVSLEIYEDEVVGIVGESGCGKTTMSNVLLMNIIKPLKLISGRVFFKSNGQMIEISKLSRQEMKERFWGKEMTVIPQSAMNALMPTIKIEKYIRHLAQSHGLEGSELLEKAKERFENVGLNPSWLQRYPFELSGGMKQRAVIAIATLLNPKLLIADEPTSALDVVNQKTFLKVLLEMKNKGIVKSIVFITHDIATVRQIADRMVVMYAGKIVEVAPTEKIICSPLHPYTKGLMNSVLTPEPQVKRRGIHTIPGAPPNLVDPPPGCRFHPRCEYATPRCKEETPELKDVNGGKVACFLYARGEHE